MKILKKSEILSVKNKQTKDQIDEGVAIAKRIDELRATLAKIEKQHSDYIAGMKEQLEKEIAGLIKQKRDLEHDIGNKRAEFNDIVGKIKQAGEFIKEIIRLN